jgi:hypothetical protein
MAITKTTQPYEFLVRWRDGAISGAHIRFLETISLAPNSDLTGVDPRVAAIATAAWATF